MPVTNVTDTRTRRANYLYLKRAAPTQELRQNHWYGVRDVHPHTNQQYLIVGAVHEEGRGAERRMDWHARRYTPVHHPEMGVWTMLEELFVVTQGVRMEFRSTFLGESRGLYVPGLDLLPGMWTHTRLEERVAGRREARRAMG